MEKSKIQEELSRLIAAGKTKDAFEWLNSQELDKQSNNTLVIIQAEYKELLRIERKDTLSASDIQARKNRINDKLLSLFDAEIPDRATSKSNALKIVLPILALLIGGLFFWLYNKPNYICPTFKEELNNKILVLPFIDLGDAKRKPELPLVNRIQDLVDKNNLSTSAQIGAEFENITKAQAHELASQCLANVIVWGDYQAIGEDSTQVTLQYYFLEKPDVKNLSESIRIKNLSSLQNGKMFKNLNDAILSLCGILAMRAGDEALAKKWFNKVKHKEAMDEELLKVL